jgi:XTP/dITP diphosphohydrolase
MLLYACSTNPGKIAEFELCARLSGHSRIEIRAFPDLRAIEPPEETGATFEENAVLKALYYSRFSQEHVFADDSGLQVDALGGEPGVFSARYSGPGATAASNNELLLRKLGPELNRHAQFVCVLALARRGELLFSARGTVEGEILNAPDGSGGFGYDPLFFYPPLKQSFAEIGPEAKFAVSHRGNAFRSFLAKL